MSTKKVQFYTGMVEQYYYLDWKGKYDLQLAKLYGWFASDLTFAPLRLEWYCEYDEFCMFIFNQSSHSLAHILEEEPKPFQDCVLTQKKRRRRVSIPEEEFEWLYEKFVDVCCLFEQQLHDWQKETMLPLLDKMDGQQLFEFIQDHMVDM